MRRGEVDGRIIYVDRHWKLSIALFLAAMAAVALPAFLSNGNVRDSIPPAAIYGGTFLLCAMVLQFRSRAFVIDPADGTLLLLERRFLLPVWRRRIPLSGLRVFTTSAASAGAFDTGSRLYWIWIDVPGRRRILFEGNLKDLTQVHNMVVQLSRDLQRESATSLLSE